MTLGVLLILSFVFQALSVNRDIPVFQGHGDADPLVPHQWGELTAKFVKQMSTKHTFKTYPNMMHHSCPEVGLF